IHSLSGPPGATGVLKRNLLFLSVDRLGGRTRRAAISTAWPALPLLFTQNRLVLFSLFRCQNRAGPFHGVLEGPSPFSLHFRNAGVVGLAQLVVRLALIRRDQAYDRRIE